MMQQSINASPSSGSKDFKPEWFISLEERELACGGETRVDLMNGVCARRIPALRMHGRVGDAVRGIRCTADIKCPMGSSAHAPRCPIGCPNCRAGPRSGGGERRQIARPVWVFVTGCGVPLPPGAA
jgi:hypothetical protein